MLLPDKATIFSHDFLELSKNVFIENVKLFDSNFVNSPKVGAYGEHHSKLHDALTPSMTEISSWLISSMPHCQVKNSFFLLFIHGIL